MANELSSEARLAIDEYLSARSKDKEAARLQQLRTIQQVVGVSVFGMASAILAAFWSIRNAAVDNAQLEAAKVVDSEIQKLTARESNYGKTMDELLAGAGTRISAAIAISALAQENGTELIQSLEATTEQSKNLAEDQGLLKKQLQDAVQASNDLLVDLQTQQTRLTQVATNLTSIEEQVGGDIAGKAALISSLLQSARSQDLGEQIEAFTRRMDVLEDDLALPIGMIVAYSGSYAQLTKSTRRRWRECDGSEIVVQPGSELERVLSLYGNRSSSGIMKLPDYRGYFLRGHDSRKTDRVLGSTQEDALANHKHSDAGHLHAMGEFVNFGYYPGGPQIVALTNNSMRDSVASGPSHIGSATETRTAAETRPMNVAITWMIRVE